MLPFAVALFAPLAELNRVHFASGVFGNVGLFFCAALLGTLASWQVAQLLAGTPRVGELLAAIGRRTLDILIVNGMVLVISPLFFPESASPCAVLLVAAVIGVPAQLALAYMLRKPLLVIYAVADVRTAGDHRSVLVPATRKGWCSARRARRGGRQGECAVVLSGVVAAFTRG